MAIIPSDVKQVSSPEEVHRVHIASWLNMSQSDEGEPLGTSGSNDRSVQVVGTFGGGAIEIHGSNDGINYSVLTDPQGIALSFNTSKIEFVTELTLFMKPVVVGGDGTTNLNVIALVRKEK